MSNECINVQFVVNYVNWEAVTKHLSSSNPSKLVFEASNSGDGSATFRHYLNDVVEGTTEES